MFLSYISKGLEVPKCGLKPLTRVVGGFQVSPFSVPWQVALAHPLLSKPFCGGTLISSRHVLTAAHCTNTYDGKWEVIVGEHSLVSSNDGIRHSKCRFVNHPEYEKNAPFDNDFAIIHLKEEVGIDSNAIPVCLPTDEHGGEFILGKSLSVSGWGKLSERGTYPDVLHQANVLGISNSVCQVQYGNSSEYKITDSMLCAGNIFRGGVDACRWDSGGM